MAETSRIPIEDVVLAEIQKGKHAENEVGSAVADKHGLLIFGTGTLKESSQDIKKYNDVGAAATCAELLNIVQSLDPNAKPQAIVLEGDNDKITIKTKDDTIAINHYQQ